MDGIRDLLRIAADRNESADRVVVRFRMDPALLKELRERLGGEGIPLTSFMEAVCTGYVRGHHTILAMLDQWMRENRPTHERVGPRPSRRDLDEIYAAVADGGNVDTGDQNDG